MWPKVASNDCHPQQQNRRPNDQHRHIFALSISFLISIFYLASNIKSGQVQAHEDYDVAYRVPNPFKLEDLNAHLGKDEYFYIRSVQSSYWGYHKKPRKTVVEEYFSLEKGLTYSVHRDDSKKDQAWAIIGDSSTGKFYVVRNPDSSNDTEIDCELDHAHSHRQVFPWQYLYNLETLSSSGKRRKRSKEAFIYGVGAIWLNAIASDARTRSLNDRSPYETSNSWSIEGKNKLRAELLFDKLSFDELMEVKHDPEAYQRRLDEQVLSAVRVDKDQLVDKTIEGSKAEHSDEYILVTHFKSGLANDSLEALKRLHVQLLVCRKQTRHQRVFPSLIRALSTSPGRAYEFIYTLETFPLLGDRAEGNYDEARHRYTWPIEYVSEVFSLDHEAQALTYEPAPDTDPNAPGHDRVDVYLSRFTEAASEARSSRHSTVYYHIVRNLEDHLHEPACMIGEREPLPTAPILKRQITFSRTDTNVAYTCHLTGLGALLMNAADFHHKLFTLYKQQIQVNRNPTDLKELTAVDVDEWRVEDKRSGWTVHFYFERLSSARGKRQSADLTDRARSDLERLVRVDIRYGRAVDMSGDIIDETGENKDEDYDLVLRYTIFDVWFELGSELLVTPPFSCKDAPTHLPDPDSDDDSLLDDMEYRPYENYDSSTDEDEKSEHEQEIEQNEGERFEFEPGEMDEDFAMPDFFEFLNDSYEYEITSELLLVDGNEESNQGKKSIWLDEYVNLEQEAATLLIHQRTPDGIAAVGSDESYYIDYDAELVFHVVDKKCRHSDDVEHPWLRLFSAQMNYYTVPRYSGKEHKAHLLENIALIESNKIGLYGVGALWRRASESGNSEFLGRRKEIVKLRDREYRRLVWLYEEHDMQMHFTFLQDTGLIAEDKAHHHYRPEVEYLELESVEISNSYEGQPTGFGRVRARVSSFHIQGTWWAEANKSQFGGKFMVPKECSDQLFEANRLREHTESGIRIPSFFDLTGGESHSYRMEYIIAQKIGHDPSEHTYSASDVRVVESFDRRANRGTMAIKLSDQDLQLFIDGVNKRIYAYTSVAHKCTTLASMKPILHATMNLSYDNDNFDRDKMYGLAALWIALSERDAKMRVHHNIDSYGRSTEVRTYYIRLKPTGSFVGESQEQEVQLAFRKGRPELSLDQDSAVIGGVKARAEERLMLDSVQVEPVITAEDIERRARPPQKFMSRVHVTDVETHVQVDWQLPEACKQLVPTGESGGGDSRPQPDSSDLKFPHLSSIVSRLNYFHMKSEVSIGGALEKVYMLEEWAHSQRTRMKSHGLGRASKKDFDLMIYQSTDEVFDLSQRWQCSRGKFPETPLELDSLNQRDGEPSVLDVWTDSPHVIYYLARTYYSPLTLWRLADKPGVRVKLASSIEIAPKPVDNSNENSYLKQLERELNKEEWLVEAPADAPHKWSYKMQFVKNSQLLKDGRVNEWHVLESITLVERDPLRDEEAGADRREYSVLIDVANYLYDWSYTGDELDQFRLPEGWGCARSSHYLDSINSVDRFKLDPEESWLLNYEASLELFTGDSKGKQQEDPELGPLELDPRRVMLPTVSGAFLISGAELRRDTIGDLFIHHHKVRYQDGTAEAKRAVYDRRTELLYEIDKQSGSCMIARVSGLGWSLDFQAPATKSTLTPGYSINLLPLDTTRTSIDESLMNLLFVDEPQQNKPGESGLPIQAMPLNKYTIQGTTVVSTYEFSVDSLKLGPTLEGPARVVRRFYHSQHHSEAVAVKGGKLNGRNLTATLHNHVSVRVFLFEPKMTAVKLILDINLQGAETPPPFFELLKAANIYQCYNDGKVHWDRQMQSFTLEYRANTLWVRLVSGHFANKIRDNLYKDLIKFVGLNPLQLDGEAHIELPRFDDLLRVHFNVLEAPTSYIYFKQMLEHTMSDELQMKSESRILASLQDCSRWCDHVNCVAMSFCAGQLCRVATARAILGRESKTLLPARLSNGAEPSPSCKYYYNDKPTRRLTLAKFSDFMAHTVNSERREIPLKHLSLSLTNLRLEPARFYASNAGQFRWQHESDSDDGGDSSAQLELEDVHGSEAHARSAKDRPATFGVLRHDELIDLAKLEQLHDTGFGLTKLAARVSDQTECLQACVKADCSVLSHCDQSNYCVLITETAPGKLDIGKLKQTFVGSEASKKGGCSILMRDYRDEYELFEDTYAPAKWANKTDADSELECAAMCRSVGSQCLSFDFCLDADNQRGTACMLQTTHVSLDSFDRSVLMPAWDTEGGSKNQLDGREVKCNHYSKSVLMDFKRLANRELAAKLGTPIRGISADKCAIDCMQDDKCQAFEYCRNDRLSPAQSCFLIRTDDLLDAIVEESSTTGAPSTPTGGERLQARLKNSASCSIYVTKQFALQDRLGRTSQLLADIGTVKNPHDSSWDFFSATIFYMFAALTPIFVGASVQILYAFYSAGRCRRRRS